MGSSFITLSKSSNIVLRARKIKSGYTLLLDIHHNGHRIHEYLKLIVSDVDRKKMTLNDRSVLKLAESIKHKRAIEINSGTYDIPINKARILLEDYLQTFIENKQRQKSKSLSKFKALIKHCRDYFPPSTTLQGISTSDVDGFKKFLLNKFKPNTVIPYYTFFGSILRQAYKEDLISINPMDKADKSIKRNESTRVFLIIDEIQLLEKTYCREDVKNAFLFCCFAGLRYSDVSVLKWEQIRKEGKLSYLYYKQIKTGNIERIPLAKQALTYLSTKRGADNDLVFPLPSKRTVNYSLNAWSKRANLGKHISFHTSRHTFATLALTYGIDIKTVSSLLGHREVKTTEIYAKIIDKKKEAAVAMLPEIGG